MKASELIQECLTMYGTSDFMCNMLEDYETRHWVRTREVVSELQQEICNQYTLHGYLRNTDSLYKEFTDAGIQFESIELHAIRVKFYKSYIDKLKKQGK